MQKGLIHIYTGEGKGKTTAAIGLAVRAISQGLKVCFVYFHKDPEKWGYKEQNVLRDIGVDVHYFAQAHPGCDGKISEEQLSKQCQDGLAFVEKTFKDNQYDLMILDEINITLRDGYLKESDVLALVKSKPSQLDLVLTGRGVPDSLKDEADLVSRIDKEKHPFDQGIKARKGIEF